MVRRLLPSHAQSAMAFCRQILAGATVKFENVGDSQSELELTDARFWREQQWTLASRAALCFIRELEVNMKL